MKYALVLVVVAGAFIGGCQPQQSAPDPERATKTIADENRRAEWAAIDRSKKDEWSRLPAEERARNRNWWNTFGTYFRNGYSDDEATAMADKLCGGRATMHPPD